MSNVPDKTTLLGIYHNASRIRQNDERVQDTIMKGHLQAPYYSGNGQEMIPASISVLLNKDDYLVTIYRGIHDSVAKGVPLKELWAELLGKVTGTCKGKGGAMHITHPASGIMVTTGVVGSGNPIANGLGLASLYKKDGRVTVSNFGDGASNIGSFHEALNLASLWKLPVIFVCQNNQYGEHTTYKDATAIEKISDRAASYSMPGIHVDGNDPIAMYAAAKEAVDRARKGDGPTLIEAMTFRFSGHLIGDKSEYIPKEDMEAAIAADPVPRYRQWLLDNKHAMTDELDSIDAEIKNELDAAVKFAMDSALPGVEELKRDVYAYELA